MANRTYWKALWRSVKMSKARFISMTSLMALGAFALVGLQMTPASMEKTAQDFIEQTNMMDLAIIADYGFNQSDQDELKRLPGVDLVFFHMADVSVEGKSEALRVFSLSETVSNATLIDGRFPKNKTELVLDRHLQGIYHIGDKLKLVSHHALGFPLLEEELTVTGFAKSADMWFPDNYGESSEGDGSLSGFGLVLPETFKSSLYSLVKIRYHSLKEIPYSSEAYEIAVNSYKKDLEDLLKDNVELRYHELKQEASEKIATAKEDLQLGEEDLVKAQNSLKEQEQQLISGEQGIGKAKTDLDGQRAAIKRSESDLQDQLAILASVKESLNQTQTQLESTKRLLDETKDRLDSQYQDLTLLEANLSNDKATLDSLATDISTAQSQLAQDIIDYESGYTITDNTGFEARANKIADDNAYYESLYDNYQSNYASYQLQLSDYHHRFFQYETGMTSYNESYRLYQSSLQHYEQSLSQLQLGESQISNSQAGLTKAEQDLGKQSDKLVDGKSKLEDAKETLTGKEEQLQKAKEAVLNSESTISSLKEPRYRIFDRSSFPGAYGYQIFKTATDNIRTVSGIFPLVLYLVASLVTLTSMTRFVDEERQKAGIYKALGYSNQDVLANFLIYASTTSLVGTLLGSLGGFYVLSPMVANLPTRQSVLGQVRPLFQPIYIIIALSLAFLSTILPTYIVSKRELAVETASLLQPKPPVKGATILLEKWSFIWRRLSFTQKVTARNIFRYKQRLFMTVLGVAGSVALLFAGLGIRSSIAGVSQRQYDHLLKYDLLVLESEHPYQEERENLMLTLDKRSDLWQDLQWEVVETQLEGHTEEIAFLVSSAHLDDFVRLQERQTNRPLHLSDQGVIISEKLARLKGVSVGQYLSVRFSGKAYQLRVGGIAEHYAGHVIYSSPSYFQAVTEQSYRPNAYLVKTKGKGGKVISSLAQDLLQDKAVKTVVQNKRLTKQLNSLAEALQSVMIILVLVATLLAVVILYNLTNINLAERVRELSTIKVLGFHPSEVTLYIYRETIILSLLGIGLGLIGGHYLHQLIIRRIGSINIMFMPKVTQEVYLIPVVTILLILMFLGIWVHYQLKKLDMLEALKSVD